ncbi:hypothetical protein [Brevibacillus sp. H7]|uniref:hypothetical protein n=1 Tax=Brevibacillus sp. H7 TaxID=3349138 RepID=UPI003829DF0D
MAASNHIIINLSSSSKKFDLLYKKIDIDSKAARLSGKAEGIPQPYPQQDELLSLEPVPQQDSEAASLFSVVTSLISTPQQFPWFLSELPPMSFLMKFVIFDSSL